MALLRGTFSSLPLAFLTLAPALCAQNDEGAVLVTSRVERCLKSLEKAPTYAFEGAMLAGNNPFANIIRMGGQGQGKPPKPKPTLIQGVRKGSLLCWTRQDGKQVLASLGSRWVQKDRDGHWIPTRGPQGSWKNAEITDPRFLASRLRELKGQTEWTMLSGVTLDERPVRCYEGTISGKSSTLLFRSGALPAGGSAGGLGQIIMIQRAVGRNLRMPETLRKVHFKIFEDPRTHLPLKIVCEVFAKQDPNGQVRVAIGGMGGQQQDDEDEDGEKKPKPTYTYTLTFSQVGKAQATPLTGKARQILGMQAQKKIEEPLRRDGEPAPKRKG